MNETERYEIIIKTTCPYCRQTVSLLEARKKDFIVIAADNDHKWLEEQKQNKNHFTVPLITKYEGNTVYFIGGYNELQQLFGISDGK